MPYVIADLVGLAVVGATVLDMVETVLDMVEPCLTDSLQLAYDTVIMVSFGVNLLNVNVHSKVILVNIFSVRYSASVNRNFFVCSFITVPFLTNSNSILLSVRRFMNIIGSVIFIYANLAALNSFLVLSVIGNAGNDFGIVLQIVKSGGAVEPMEVMVEPMGLSVEVSTFASRLTLDSAASTPSRLYFMMLLTATLYSLLRIMCLFSRVVK